MRAALALVIATTSLAAADSPPSKTLERAIELYDKKDFYSATIELQKVLDGDSGDDAVNKQRAQFFLAKSLYQMGYYAVANGQLSTIASQATNTYNNAALKWLAATVRVLGVSNVPGLRSYKLDAADDPSLASVRDELLYYFGEVALDQGDFKVADKAFADVAAASEFYAHARIGLGASAMRQNDDKTALAALSTVPANTDGNPANADAGDLARLGIVMIDVRANKWDDAIAAAGKVGGTLAARGAWEVLLAKAAKKGVKLGGLDAYARTPVVTAEAPEPALLQLVATCSDKADALAGFRHDAAALTKELDALAAEDADDDTELYVHRGAALHAGTAKLSARATALVKAALSAPSLEHAYSFVAELDHELTQLSHSDKAWQTTMVAANMLQDLTIEKSVAEADLGKRLRFRLRKLADGVRAIAADTTKLPCG